MGKYTIYISQVYEFRDTIEVEAEDSGIAQEMALERFRCDWEKAICHADLLEIAFLDAEETEAPEEVQALEAMVFEKTTKEGE